MPIHAVWLPSAGHTSVLGQSSTYRTLPFQWGSGCPNGMSRSPSTDRAESVAGVGHRRQSKRSTPPLIQSIPISSQARTDPLSKPPGSKLWPSAAGSAAIRPPPVLDCRRRRNGNTPAGLVRRPNTGAATPKPISPASVGMAKNRAAGLIQSEESLPTLGASTMSTATSTSGPQAHGPMTSKAVNVDYRWIRQSSIPPI